MQEKLGFAYPNQLSIARIRGRPTERFGSVFLRGSYNHPRQRADCSRLAGSFYGHCERHRASRGRESRWQHRCALPAGHGHSSLWDRIWAVETTGCKRIGQSSASDKCDDRRCTRGGRYREESGCRDARTPSCLPVVIPALSGNSLQLVDSASRFFRRRCNVR
jgi:hypothetical protein